MKLISHNHNNLVRKAVTGLVIAGALVGLSGCSLLSTQTEEPNTAPTEPQIPDVVPADPQSEGFTMRSGDTITFTLPVGEDWSEADEGAGYFNEEKTCIVGFQSKDDAAAGTKEETEEAGLTEEDVKDIYFQETGVQKFGTSVEKITETQKDYNIEIDGHFVEFKTAPIVREDTSNGYYGLASWPYEGTYVAVLMNCNVDVSADQAQTTWELAMNQAVGTKN